MESKKCDALRATTLTSLIEGLDKNNVTKEDIVNVFFAKEEYIAVFFK